MPEPTSTRHQILVTIDDYNGLTPHLQCVDHEPDGCGPQAVFQWDSASAMEGYYGDRIEFAPIDIDVIASSEDEGFEWQTRPAAQDYQNRSNDA